MATVVRTPATASVSATIKRKRCGNPQLKTEYAVARPEGINSACSHLLDRDTMRKAELLILHCSVMHGWVRMVGPSETLEIETSTVATVSCGATVRAGQPFEFRVQFNLPSLFVCSQVCW